MSELKELLLRIVTADLVMEVADEVLPKPITHEDKVKRIELVANILLAAAPKLAAKMSEPYKPS